MTKIFLAILAISLLTSCNNSEKKHGDKTDHMEMVSAPDTDNETQKELSNCVFSDPDTSVAGIKIRNEESTSNILGKQGRLEGASPHVFYSTDKTQKIGLTVHPGDNYNQVSIFNISYSDNTQQNFRQLKSKVFETEKGIKLGITKSEIIEKLGTCYSVKDSTNSSMELNYRIELPDDSKTKLLKRNNMPIYYATYRVTNDKLVNIEFGFEIP